MFKDDRAGPAVAPNARAPDTPGVSTPTSVTPAVAPTVTDDETVAKLPPANTTRWVARRKAEVVAAVNDGVLTIAGACERYGLTLEEFAGWQRAVEREGIAGLRATRVQYYRQMYERAGRRDPARS